MRTLEFCRHLLNELESPTLRNFQRQADARYLLYNVNETNLPRFNTNLNESLSIAAYMYISLGIDFHHYEQISESEKCFERAGSILEHLNRNKEHQDDISQYTLLISSLSYYCGGQISKAFVLAKDVSVSGDVPIGKMIYAFLTRKYQLLQEILDGLLLEPDDKLPLEVTFGRLLAYVLYFFEHGDFEKLDLAISGVANILQKAMEIRDPGLWWVCCLLEFVFQRIKETSLWSHVPRLGEDEYIYQKYIHNLYYSHQITELFKTQIEALNVILRGEGAVISLPTSSGKTRIAELAILRALMADSETAILYLAPFRSLAYEVETNFKEIFNPLNITVSHLYGNNDFSESDRKAMNESSIWIATPEKAKAIFRCGGFIKKISLVILDEGHLISSNGRDLANEMFVEELRCKISASGGQFLVLSAVLPNVGDITKWLCNSEDNSFKSDWQISSQRAGIIVGYKKVADIEWNPDKTFFNNNFVTGAKDRKTTCAKVAIRLQQAFGSVLVYVPQARFGLNYAKSIYEQVGDAEVNWLDGTCDWDKFMLKCQEEDPQGQLLDYAKRGVICHNADLPSNLRMSIERLLRKGKAKYVVSSSTLAQGVNIGVSSVVFTSTSYGKGYLNKRDFWNIAGRAGRAFIDTEGRILLYVDGTNNVDRNRWFAWRDLRDHQLNQVVSGLLTVLRDMLVKFDEYGFTVEKMESVLENDEYDTLSEDDQNIFDKLEYVDDSLLSLILEHDSSLEELSTYIESMLVLRQAEVEEKARVRRLLLARIRRNIKYKEVNKSFLSCTGMPIAAAAYLYEHIHEISAILQKYIESPQQLDDILLLVDKLEDVVNNLPSKRVDKLYKNVLNQYRQAWFGGVFIADKEARDDIEDFYSLSMSWVLNAMSGYYSTVPDGQYVTDIIGRINACLRLGLPTYSACRVFMAGIESRQAAIELSPYVVDYLEEKTSILQILLLEIKDTSALSELTRAWLSVLRKEDRVFNESRKYIKQCRLDVEDEGTDQILYICKKGEEYYVRNADYSFVRKINPNGNNMERMINKPGVYYYKVDNKQYELVSENNRYWIEND